MTIQRTTQQAGIDRVSYDLSNNLRQLQESQHQLATGKRINRLSDDPASVGTAVQLRASMGRSAQYQRNMDDGLARLNEADRSLQQVVDQLARVKELAMQAMSGASSADDRAAIASELAQIKEQIAATANTSYLGVPIFGGTSGGTQAYDATGTYVGDATAVERNVAPGVKVAVNVSGSAIFDAGGQNIFTSLQNLIDDVTSNPANLQGDVDQLELHFSTVQQGLAEVGGRVNRLEALKTHTDASIASMEQQLSSIEDVDLEKALLEQKAREFAYQAALAATARVIQPSLVDFLK